MIKFNKGGTYKVTVLKEGIYYNTDEVAKMFMNMFDNEPPCNYNNIDEMCCCDDWCEWNCGKCESIDCWIHVIESGWLDEI